MATKAKTTQYFDLDPKGRLGREVAELKGLRDLPFPVGYHVGRCVEMIERQEPVVAVWYLKDSVEAVVRLCFVVTAAEVLRLEEGGSGWLACPEECKGAVRELAHFVRYNPYPSLGAWLRRLEDLVLPLADTTREGSLTRQLSQVWGTRGGVGGKLADLKDWRNRFMGHGALGSPERAAKELKDQLGRLLHVVRGLEGFFAGARLVCERDLEEDEVHGEGARLEPVGAAGVSVRPLIELLALPGSQRRRVGFLEAGEERRSRLKFRTPVRGVQEWVDRGAIRKGELEAVEALAARVEKRGYAVEAPEGALPVGWLEYMEGVRFADFSEELYTEPSYLVEQVERLLTGCSCGAVRIVGPAGCGKSFAVRGMVERWRRERPWLVLPFYAQAGRGCDPAAFVDRLNVECSGSAEALRAHGIMLNKPGDPPTVGTMREWLEALLRFNPGVERLIVAIDGLDEIQPKEAQADIVGLLPRQLPEGLMLLLSGRGDEELDHRVRHHLGALPWVEGSPVWIHVSPGRAEGEPMRGVLRNYLSKHWGIRRKDLQGAILEAGEERFLHVAMLARGVREGVFSKRALPRRHELAVAFIEGLLRKCALVPAYRRSLEQTVAFLGVAAMAVPVECLVDWGIDERYVAEALVDLGGILARERQRETDLVRGGRESYRYRIYHGEVIRQLREHEEWGPRLAEAERRLVERLQEDRAGRWGDEEAVSWERPEDAYAMVALAGHAKATGSTVPTEDLEAIGWRLVDRAPDLVKRYGNPMGALQVLQAAEQGIELVGEGEEGERVKRLRMAHSGTAAEAYLSLGETGQALDAGVRAEALARELVERVGRLPEQLRDLSVSLGNVADLLRAEGRREEALARYEEAESISRELVVRVGRLPQPLRDLSVSLHRVADVLLAEGRREEALARYEESERIARELVERVGRLPEPLRDLSVSLDKVADVLLAEGRRAEALARYEESERIRRELVERVGRLREPLRDLSVSLERVANVLLAEGRRAEALARYEESERIARELVERVGRLREPLRDLSVSLDKVADVLLAEGRREEALARYLEAESIDRELVERVGRLPEQLRDLSVSLNKVADVLLAEGRREEALARYEEAERIRRELVERVGRLPQPLRDLSVSLDRVANVLLAEGRRAEALARYEESERISRELVERFVPTPQMIEDLARAIVRRAQAAFEADDERFDQALDEAEGLMARLMPEGRARMQVSLMLVDGSRDPGERVRWLERALEGGWAYVEAGGEIPRSDLELLTERVSVDQMVSAARAGKGERLGVGLVFGWMLRGRLLGKGLSLEDHVRLGNRDLQVLLGAKGLLSPEEWGACASTIGKHVARIEEVEPEYAAALRRVIEGPKEEAEGE